MKIFGLTLSISIIFLGITLSALRRRALREQVAVLWVLVSVAMLALSLTLPFHLLDDLAHDLGIAYGSDLVFLCAGLLLVGLVLQLSVSLARLSAKFTRLVQEIGISNATSDDVDTGRLRDGESSP